MKIESVDQPREGPGRCGMRIWLAIPAVAFLCVCKLLAQNPQPHIGYVYPAGGQRGKTTLVTVGGQFLDGATNAYVSGTGISAKVIELVKPMSMGQFNTLRDKFLELQQRKQAAMRRGQRQTGAQPSSTNQWTAEDEKTLTEIREQILKYAPNRQAAPAVAETVKLEVTIQQDASLGDREIRLGTRSGLTNPLKFCVGALEETSKPHSTPPNPALDRFRERFTRAPVLTQTNTEIRIALPTVLNGQILVGGVDRFRFSARRGQRLVFVAQARALIPYLADAVPGWFQSTLAVYDAKGRELAYCDDFEFNPDPVLFFEVPSTGEYFLEVKDALYRGREDFVYRITAGELPFITSIFPLGGRPGETTTIELEGWNLPVKTLTRTNASATASVECVLLDTGKCPSNSMPFDVDDLPECVELEPNDIANIAQEIVQPIIVNGRIGTSGDRDAFRFRGKAGDKVVVEVRARRLNSPLDSVVELRELSGAVVARNDDFPDRSAALITHQADSYIVTALPSDGDYLVCITDAQQKGGAEYSYRLRVSSPRPDFSVRVVPSSVNMRAGATFPLAVYALRKDGFDREITLRLGGETHGFTLSGTRIPPGSDRVRVTLTAPQNPLTDPINLTIEGLAIVGGKPVARAAAPADDMTQAFAYHHLVPATELKVAVIGRQAMRLPSLILSSEPVRIALGGTTRTRFNLGSRNPGGRFELELDDPPEGIELESSAISDGTAEISLKCDGSKAKAHLKGNLIFKVVSVGGQGTRNRQAAQRRSPIGYLPAIPFEITDSGSSRAQK
ncbi:MAG: hypothetical protein QHJ82_12310 [Verrucomicrobiota bacterium]|nr:hypothetical protein [Verrucomicrobiota bacterium]